MSAVTKYGDRRWDVSVYDMSPAKERSDDARLIDSIYTFVYNAGTKTLSTLYKDANRATSLSNPISRADFAALDGLRFYCAEESLDFVVSHSDGTFGRFTSVNYYDHSIAIDRSNPFKQLIIPFGVSDNTEVDTTIDLPYDCWVRDVFLNVRTVDATETLAVGLLSSETAGDADGLLVAPSVATAGWVKPYATTAGGTETYVSTASYGALMGPVVVGADVATDHGVGAPPGHIVTGSNAVSVTYTGSAGTDTAVGDIYLRFDMLR